MLVTFVSIKRSLVIWLQCLRFISPPDLHLEGEAGKKKAHPRAEEAKGQDAILRYLLASRSQKLAFKRLPGTALGLLGLALPSQGT